ncbi:VCBS repeat-containing protein [Litoricolaceae bacterium]|nr:VCBS repeat-containing protein [Litorivicinaceae bacterium]
MPRFSTTDNIFNAEVPWAQTQYFVNRSGVIEVNNENLVWVKLGLGSLQLAESAPLKLLKIANGAIEDVSYLLNASADFAVTRNILVGDIDGDGNDDFFLNNHGPETPSGFPGEQNAIYLFNESNETFDEIIFPWMDFSHGSSLGDFDGDGYIDVLVNNLGSIENVPSYLLKQTATGSFQRVPLPVSLVDDIGPLTTAIDVDRNGTSDLVSVSQAGELTIYRDVLNASSLISATQLPITDAGTFELVTSDFDKNGQDDVLVLGTGDELQEGGIVVGGILKVLVIFDAGTSEQTVINVLDFAGLELLVTGGQQVAVVDLDNSSTPDLSITTFTSDWHQIRVEVFFDDDRNPDVIAHTDEETSINSIYVDVTNDGVKDLISIPSDNLSVNAGVLLDRFNSKAYDAAGSAGQTAKTLAAVIGEEGLSNKEYVGIGLQLFDAGQSLATVCELALNAVGATTNQDVVTTLYSNLYGESPSDDQLQEYVELLDQGVFTKGSLAAAAAELTDDLGVINLVGLAETGIEYV